MRYTIPGSLNDCARVTVRNGRMSRGEWRSIACRGDLLNGLMGRDHLPPVHRERVRFGAWEERPTSVVWQPLDLTPYREEFRVAVNAIADVYLETPAALAAVERSIARMGGSEAPPVSGPENAYKCEGAS